MRSIASTMLATPLEVKALQSLLLQTDQRFSASTQTVTSNALQLLIHVTKNLD